MRRSNHSGTRTRSRKTAARAISRPIKLLGTIPGIVATLSLVACGANGTGGSGSGSYFDGKTITIIVPANAGGGTDTSARYAVPYLEKYLGKNVKIRIQNIDAAGGVGGMNQFAQQDKDFDTLAFSSGSSNIAYLVGQDGVDFDFHDMTPLVSTSGVTIAMGDSDIDWKDYLSSTPPRQLIWDGESPTGQELRFIIGTKMWGVHGIKWVWGRTGGSDISVALQQGELNIGAGSLTTYVSQLEPLVKSGKLDMKILVQSGEVNAQGEVVRDDTVPDVPTVGEVYQQLHGTAPSGPAWDAYTAVVAAANTNEGVLWAHSGEPAAAQSALRSAVTKMLNDPKFKAGEEAATEKEWVGGDQAAGAVKSLVDPDPSAVTWLRNFLAEDYDVHF